MFKEIPAGRSSISKRKLVFGVGINDADYIVRPRINGKLLTCPFYAKWYDMLTRCYSAKMHKRHQTYKDCSVFDGWLIFSNFKKWMIRQDWEEKDLDKDLRYTGNKIYSPETCIFVSQEINTLTMDCGASRGELPKGVYLHHGGVRFVASYTGYGKKKHIGCFGSPEKASEAYKKEKSQHILDIATTQDEQLRGYLIRIASEHLA